MGTFCQTNRGGMPGVARATVSRTSALCAGNRCWQLLAMGSLGRGAARSQRAATGSVRESLKG